MSIQLTSIAGNPYINDEPVYHGVTTGRNKIINGGFDIWQRGESFTTNGFTSDRWSIGTSSIISGNSLDIPSDEGLTYSNRMEGNNTGTLFLSQKIENGINLLKNKVATLSFWQKSSLNNTINNIYMLGEGGGVLSIASSVQLSDTWTKYSYTFTIDDSFPVGGYLNVRFDFTASSSVEYIAGVQLEEGSVATPFEQRPIGLELSLCQRYYQEYSGTTMYLSIHDINSGSKACNIIYPTKMRTVPSHTETETNGAFTYAIFDDYMAITQAGGNVDVSSRIAHLTLDAEL